jgi:hypothetical protein
VSESELAAQSPFSLSQIEIIGKLGIKPVTEEVSPKEIRDALGRVGESVRSRYGDEIFQNDLGRNIRQDLKNAANGGSLTIADEGLIVMASGQNGSLTIKVGFTGEPMKTCTIESGTRFLEAIGLHLLPGEQGHD